MNKSVASAFSCQTCGSCLCDRGVATEAMSGICDDVGSQQFLLTIVLPPDQLMALARQVADLVIDDRDDGFFDVSRAAAYLSTTRKAIYHLVERGQLPHHRAGGRLLFDRAEMRLWVERGG